MAIPSALQSQVLKELHVSHPGIVRMKGIARAKVWWPGMSKAIEKKVQSCSACQAQWNQPPPVPLHSWPLTREPWERVHIDFAGPVDGVYYFILVDSYSKWIEVEPMHVTTAEWTLGVLRSIFARYGLPRELVSDNGPQFVSAVFHDFLRQNGICHTRSPPYHPATNGAAERVVQTFKRALRTGTKDAGSLRSKLSRFLLSYRTTPHSSTGQAPAELFLHRSLRTRLDILRPSGDRALEQQQRAKAAHDKHAQDRSFVMGQKVLVRNWQEGPRWVKGVVVKHFGAVQYEVDIGGALRHCHADHLLPDRGKGDEAEGAAPAAAPVVMENAEDQEYPEPAIPEHPPAAPV